MAKKRPCPSCHRPMNVKAITDGDGRIYSSWYRCVCGYDQRINKKEMNAELIAERKNT